ncbi:hypothetical protein HGA92_01405 [Candidatus Gracilibacteria bacterium]|nr:hypothetical protein [Candidatus Gracilibacteria bacterium]NUJ98734.1 hypothetical protein [Candidatus Gracilibacteria bacterium]
MKLAIKIVLFVFLVFNFGNSFGSYFETTESLATEKKISSLIGKEKWGKYKIKLDKIVVKINGNEEIIIKKIEENKLFRKKTSLEYLILEYINIQLKENLKEKNIVVEKENIKNQKMKIGEADKKEVKRAIIQIEKIINEKQKKLGIDKVNQDKLSSSGKISFSFFNNFSQKYAYSGSVSFEDFLLQIQENDLKFSSNIDININNNGKETVLFTSFESLLKDGIIYYTLDKLDVKKESEESKPYIDILKKIDEKNMYIRQEQNKSLIENNINNLTKNLNKRNSLSFIFGEKAFFEAIKKEDANTYKLIPTQELCESLKGLQNKEETCSENELFELIKPFIDGTFNLQIKINGNTNTLSLYGKEKNLDIESHMIFSSDDIELIQIEMMPNQKIFPSEGFSFHYKKREKLHISLNAENGKIDGNILLSLDENNQIRSGNGNIKSDFVEGSFEIKEKILSGNISIKESNKEKIHINFYGNIDEKGRISNFKSDFTGKAIFSPNDIFSGSWTYNTINGMGINTLYTNGQKNMSINIKTKDSNQENYEGFMNFSYEEKEVGEMKYNLNYNIKQENKSSIIEVPKTSISLEELLQDMREESIILE